jgi:hypothetical protein
VSNNPLGVVRGAAAIGAAIGVSPRRAYWLLERGVLPAVKEGSTWTSTLDRLRRFYEGDDPPNAVGPAPAATEDRPHSNDRLCGAINPKIKVRTATTQAVRGGQS